jgi:hypothetical protein
MTWRVYVDDNYELVQTAAKQNKFILYSKVYENGSNGKKIKNKKKETSPNTALSPFMCFAIASLLPGHIYPAHLLSACLQINSIFF